MHAGADNLLFTDGRDWVSLSTRYPWYATARLGRLLQQPDDPEAAKLAAVVLDNPLRTNWWLAHQSSEIPLTIEGDVSAEVPESLVAEVVANAARQTDAVEEVSTPDTAIIPTGDALLETLSPESPADPTPTPAADFGLSAEYDTEAAQQTDQNEALVTAEAAITVTDEEASTEALHAEAPAETTDQQPESVSQATEPTQAVDSNNRAENKGIEAAPATPTTAADEPAPDDADADDHEANTTIEADEAVPNRLGNTLQQALEAMHAPVAHQQPDLPAFQPHHTIDYFEAVGIRFRDVAQKDKLYGQVKTFTQWLKAMKQIDYKTGNVAEDKAVSSNAAASLQPQEIFTETMAEVLLRQGRKAEAVAIFTHLQALHPDKSAYFAARLNDLKST